MQVCGRCKQYKKESEFYPTQKYRCKECYKEYQLRYYKEKRLAQGHVYETLEQKRKRKGKKVRQLPNNVYSQVTTAFEVALLKIEEIEDSYRGKDDAPLEKRIYRLMSEFHKMNRRSRGWTVWNQGVRMESGSTENSLQE